MARSGYYPDDQDVKQVTKVAGRRGNLIWRPWRGKIIVQTLPRWVAETTLETLKPWTAWLRIQNILWHYSDWHVRLSCLYLERISGIPARDWFMSAARGHVFSYTLPDGAELFSMATRDKYSRSLDVFGQTYGSLLWRDTEAWNTLEPGEDGMVLALSEGKPVWSSGGGGGIRTIWFNIEAMRGYNATIGYILSTIPALGLSQSGKTGATLNVLRTGVLGEFIPSNARLLVHAPSNADGGVHFILEARALVAEGEPYYLGQVGETITLTSGNRKFITVDLAIPTLGVDAVGYNLLVGRDAENPNDNCGVALNLLGVEIG